MSPETRKLEVERYSIEVSCDDCANEADVCFCEHHYEVRLAEEYERGVADGKEEAEEDYKNDEEELREALTGR